MSFSILQLTSSDAVRSTLGVDAQDVPDAFLEPLALEDVLKIELMQWYPDYANDTTLAASQKTVVKLMLQQYAKYTVAWFVATSQQQHLMQEITDGQNGIQRYASFKWQDFLDLMASQALRYRKYILEQKGEDIASVGKYSQFGVAAPTYDPVTNEVL